MSTLAVCNLEGGVGRTTVTFNVAAALAQMGHSVLLIDADPHSSLTHSLGLNSVTLTNALVAAGDVLKRARERHGLLVFDVAVHGATALGESADPGVPVFAGDEALHDRDAP